MSGFLLCEGPQRRELGERSGEFDYEELTQELAPSK